jgi:hypothetical protein
MFSTVHPPRDHKTCLWYSGKLGFIVCMELLRIGQFLGPEGWNKKNEALDY